MLNLINSAQDQKGVDTIGPCVTNPILPFQSISSYFPTNEYCST